MKNVEVEKRWWFLLPTISIVIPDDVYLVFCFLHITIAIKILKRRQ